MSSITESAKALMPKLSEIRRDFHMHPEVSQHEERTGKKVAEYLKAMGCDEVHENVGGYGVVGVIKGKKYGTAKITMKASGVKTKKITVYVRKAATGIKLSSVQTINFYNINDAMYLVDLPGYGYAKASEEVKAKWGKMIENYLHTSKQLKAVFLLIDIRHDPSANDRMMYEWMVYQGFAPIIIATKLDKIKRSQIQKNVKAIREGLNVQPGTTIIPFSAETKQGRDEIWKLIDSFVLPQEEK